ncbi:hypothetical protein [Anaerovorax odorimutans]|uniref:hypothetical protein n=1 Tax=Anaerovorax odorimutans TaxID=109327 RepID=UPI0003F76998|nr:hypothetical protein [Anaerovorax odorimutans]
MLKLIFSLKMIYSIIIFLVIMFILWNFIIIINKSKPYFDDLEQHPVNLDTAIEKEMIDTYNLVTLNENTTFYVYKSNSYMYKVITKENGEFETISFSSNVTKVIEENSITPHLEKYKSEIPESKYKSTAETYKLYIPEGSITEDFNIEWRL